jgi:hypothetical protein
VGFADLHLVAGHVPRGDGAQVLDARDSDGVGQFSVHVGLLDDPDSSTLANLEGSNCAIGNFDGQIPLAF